VDADLVSPGYVDGCLGRIPPLTPIAIFLIAIDAHLSDAFGQNKQNKQNKQNVCAAGFVVGRALIFDRCYQ
jgi:uncharacterized oligopeptide transporter (OPT) family protein